MNKKTCYAVFTVLTLIIVCMVAIVIYKEVYIYSKDYHLNLQRDSVTIYSNTRAISTIPYGKDGIDSVILVDSD